MAEDGRLIVVPTTTVDDNWQAAQCRDCRTVHLIPITAAEVRRWRGGEHIQIVMPDLSPAQRELLISGTCGPCFDRLFAEPDDHMLDHCPD